MSSDPAAWSFQFFNSPDYLHIYGGTVGEARTEKELRFCETALGWAPGSTVLDAPCGQGRHSRLLSRMGMRVIGIDYSPYLLGIAREPVDGRDSEDVTPPNPVLIRGDLSSIPVRDNLADFAISMFSSFGYGNNHDHNVGILREYARVLRPGGQLLIDVMNRHFIARFLSPLYRHHERGMAVQEERQLVEAGRRLVNIITVTDPQGNIRSYPYKPWLFNGWELSLMAKEAGLHPVRVYGDFNGDDYDLESERAMLVARKPN